MIPILILALTACNDDKGDTGGVEDEHELGEHACEHTGEAGTAITATADIAKAPTVALAEEPYTVSLVDGSAGYIALTVDEATTAVLFMGTADVASSLYSDATEVGLPAGTANDHCSDDIPEHFHLDLDAAGTWQIELGPAAVDDVWLMLMDAGEHSHDE